MRTFLLMFVAIGAVVVTGAASANTVAVTITKAGYVPKAATIVQGDSVQFTNSDTVAHQVVFKTTAGSEPARSSACTEWYVCLPDGGVVQLLRPEREEGEHVPRDGDGHRSPGGTHAFGGASDCRLWGKGHALRHAFDA